MNLVKILKTAVTGAVALLAQIFCANVNASLICIFVYYYPRHKYRPLYLHNNQLVFKIIIYAMNRMSFPLDWYDKMKLNEV